jgi:hypothetical protein
MDVNVLLVVGLGVAAMAIGAIWYGPLFGGLWMKVVDMTDLDLEAREKMQKAAGPLYLVQFALVIFQLVILSWLIAEREISGIGTAMLLWLGFVMPTIAGSAMWNAKPGKIRLTMFLLQSGYQLVCFLLFGFVLGQWG